MHTNEGLNEAAGVQITFTGDNEFTSYHCTGYSKNRYGVARLRSHGDLIKNISWAWKRIQTHLSTFMEVPKQHKASRPFVTSVASWRHLVMYIWIDDGSGKACCRSATRHYLNQRWLILGSVLYSFPTNTYSALQLSEPSKCWLLNGTFKVYIGYGSSKRLTHHELV